LPKPIPKRDILAVSRQAQRTSKEDFGPPTRQSRFPKTENFGSLFSSLTIVGGEVCSFTKAGRITRIALLNPYAALASRSLL
jgi:hypothetical protein